MPTLKKDPRGDYWYYDNAETNKLLKEALKKAFPGVAFTVKGSRGTAHGYTRLEWIDGPTEAQVKPIAWEFDGYRADPHQVGGDYTDYVSTYTTDAEGRKCQYGAKLMISRGYSEAHIRAAYEQVAQQWGFILTVRENKGWKDEIYYTYEMTPEAGNEHKTGLGYANHDWHRRVYGEVLKDKSFMPSQDAPQEIKAGGKLKLTGDVMGGAWWITTEQAELILKHWEYVAAFANGQPIPNDFKGEFKGRVTLRLADTFSFGQAKAKLALTYETEIKAFAGGELTTQPAPAPDANEPPPAEKIAARFRALAQNMEKEVSEKLNASLGNQNWTNRRARMLESKIQDGERLQLLQKSMLALADHWEAGTVPPELTHLRTRKDVAGIMNERDYAGSGWNGEPIWKDRPIRALLLSLIQDRPSHEAAKLAREAKNKALSMPIPGFFPTPEKVIDQMLDYADLKRGEDVLEPSAGMGHIVDALKALDLNLGIDLCEISPTLRDVLTGKGYTWIEKDIFDLTDGDYDKILMNPPFENGDSMCHVRHCYTLLKPGGRLVAILPAPVQTRDDAKHREFRDWVDTVAEGVEWVEIEAGAFLESDRPTGVSTVMLVLDKPATKATESKVIPFTLAASMAEATPQPATLTQSLSYKVYAYRDRISENGLHGPEWEEIIVNEWVYYGKGTNSTPDLLIAREVAQDTSGEHGRFFTVQDQNLNIVAYYFAGKEMAFK